MSVYLSVCKVDEMRLHSATKTGKEHMTGQVYVSATSMSNMTWIVISCDPVYIKNVEFCTSAASSGSHVVLSQHLLIFLFCLL